MTDIEQMLAEMQAVLEATPRDASHDDQGLSCQEWAEVWGLSLFTARRRLNQLWAQGQLITGRRTVTYMDGRAGKLPVYRPKMP